MPEAVETSGVALVLQRYKKSILTFLLFILYAGAVFWSNYETLQRLNANALVQFQLETEKQASAISYYFSERRDDIAELAESEVVVNFFKNLDLGMSYKYGLGLNVQLIEDRFEHISERKKIGDQAVYSGFLLIDGEGMPVASWSKPEMSRIILEWLDPENRETRTRLGTQQGELMVSSPVWINNIYRGELLAWINANTSLAQFGTSRLGGQNFLVDRETGTPLNSGATTSPLPEHYWREFQNATGKKESAPLTLENGDAEKQSIVKVDIGQTPLSFVAISAEYSGEGSARLFLLAAAIIPLIVLFVAFLDMRERRRLENLSERARIEAEQLAQARSDFLANMSHEIRTPMNAIIGMTELCLNTVLNPKQQNYLNKIQRASNSLLRIVNDILDFSKIESGKLEIEQLPFDLDYVLNDLSALFSEKVGEKSIELVFDVDTSCNLEFVGDALRLEQILINLISNAIKFSGRGNIVVRIRCAMVDETTVQAFFEIQDEGIGISPENQARLFNAFTQADTTTTRRFGGTGLGLAICKRLVELMGGTIWVDSAPNQGSNFHFFVFLKTDQTRLPPINDMRSKLAPFAHRPVLVVDDNPVCRSAIASQLGQLGLVAEECASASDARIAVSRADAPDYLVILIDTHMPDDDGMDTLRELSGAWLNMARPPVVLASSYSHKNGLEIGTEDIVGVFDGLIEKPTTATHLFTEIAPLLGIEDLASQSSTTGAGFEAAGLQGLEVLLVDDLPLNQEVVRDMLESAGMRVRLANNGREALEAIAQQCPDCVIMDCQMPVMDGYEATRKIREDGRYATLPIIALTANALPSERERCREAGMNAYVAKPVRSADLLAALSVNLPLRDIATVGLPRQEVIRRPSPGSLPELPGIDSRIGLHYANGKPAIYRKLLCLFRDSHGRDFETGFNAALESGDRKSATRMAHSLKSSARMIGAIALGEHARVLEEYCLAGEDDRLALPLADLVQELDRVCAGLAEIDPKSDAA